MKTLLALLLAAVLAACTAPEEPPPDNGLDSISKGADRAGEAVDILMRGEAD